MQQERHDAYSRLFDADAPLPPPIVKAAHSAGSGGGGASKQLVGALAGLKSVAPGKASLVAGVDDDDDEDNNENEEEEEQDNDGVFLSFFLVCLFQFLNRLMVKQCLTMSY